MQKEAALREQRADEEESRRRVSLHSPRMLFWFQNLPDPTGHRLSHWRAVEQRMHLDMRGHRAQRGCTLGGGGTDVLISLVAFDNALLRWAARQNAANPDDSEGFWLKAKSIDFTACLARGAQEFD